MIKQLKKQMRTIGARWKGFQREQVEVKEEFEAGMDFAATKPYQLLQPCQAYLQVKQNAATVSLRPGLLVGRGQNCHLTLEDPCASRVHLVFSRVQEGWLIRDNSSRNGTLLNGEFIQSALLQHGDEIQIGQTTLQYEER